MHVRVRVGSEHYALPVSEVLEVADIGAVTPVPGAPAAVLGVRNLRGRVLPVADLATLMGLAEGPVQKMVVVDQGGRCAGLAVEEIVGVDELPAASEAVESDRLDGAALVHGTLVGIIDVASVLDSIGPA